MRGAVGSSASVGLAQRCSHTQSNKVKVSLDRERRINAPSRWPMTSATQVADDGSRSLVASDDVHEAAVVVASSVVAVVACCVDELALVSMHAFERWVSPLALEHAP